MNLNPVILAIPMYFTLMAVELVFEGITRKRTYRLNDAVTNINTGVLQQLSGTFLKVFNIGIYTFIYESFALFRMEPTWMTFVVVFIAYDFCFYWSHRMSHEISLFWGGHVVHHQSEEFNLSVALRQTSTGFIWSIPFYLPLAVLGMDPVQFVLAGGFNLLYQFWIHTEHINKLPRWFEAVMNTPSHHRVHHARDPKYLDKNYAGVFIVWDKLFGTFIEEQERPNYGITKPLNSWNPVYANFAHYIDLYHHVRRTRSLGDALRVLFKPPGWLPGYLGGYQRPKELEAAYRKYNVHPNSLKMNTYILTQFLFALGITSYYLFSFHQFDGATKGLFAVWIVITTLMFGFLFESESRWLGVLESLRLAAVPAGFFALQSFTPVVVPAWIITVVAIFAALSWLAFQWISGSNRALAVG